MTLLLLIVSIICIVLMIALYTYFTCFHSPSDRTQDPYSIMEGEQYQALADRIQACTRRMDEASFEWVHTGSFDGLTLEGRYYHHADGAPVLILMHGYRSMTLRDSAGGYFLGKKMGFNVLAADQRAHAGSEGRVISFGIHERRDCLSWIEYANARFGKDIPIVISGLSMGASTVLMAAELELPENVAAVMADSPYSSPADIIRKVARDRHIPDNLAMPFILLGAKLYGGFNLKETTAENAVANSRTPILLLHGEDDRFVPCEMSHAIYKNCPEGSKLVTFPDAGHGLCYILHPKDYERAAVEFLYQQPLLREHMMHNSFCKDILDQSSV